MKKLIILFILFAEISVMYAGNPIMVIRCRANAFAATSSALQAEDLCDNPNTVSFEGHCFPLAVEGSCASIIITGFDDLSLAPQTETIGEVEMTICVPDCSSFGTDSKWSATQQECVCLMNNGEVVVEIPNDYEPCGCPYPLEAVAVIPGVVDGTGGCELPTKGCYNEGLKVDIDPIMCDGPAPSSEEITIFLTKANPTDASDTYFPDWGPDDAVSINDLLNCDLINNTNEIIDLVNTDGAFGAAARPAFVPKDDGTGKLVVEIVFTRDPNEPTVISFLGDKNENITIPVCPRVSDPCSCRPENITDADGVVQYWYDELSFLGNPNQDVRVVTNAESMGFLNEANQAPIMNGTVIGRTDATGLLTYPFYRTPGVNTEVTLQDALSNTSVTLSSECNLSVNSCNNVVPTMGEWSVIILSLMMLILGLVSMKYKSGTLIPIKEIANSKRVENREKL